MALNEDLRDRIINREALKLRLENRYDGLIRRAFRRHARELRTILSTGGDQRVVLRKIRQEVRRNLQLVHRELLRELRDLTLSEKRFALRLLRGPLNSLVVIKSLSDSELLSRVLRTPLIDTRTFDQHFAYQVRSVGSKMGAWVSQAYREGVPTEELARTIRSSGPFRVSEQHARTLARTALTEYSSRSSNAIYMENSDIITGYQYVATLDTRTTPICSSLDGRVFPLNEEGYRPKPPQHYNCRSTTTPVVGAVDDLPLRRGARVTSRTRASIDGQVPASVNYDQWLRRRAYSTRLAHFDGRVELLEAFDSGVPLDKLVNKRSQKYIMSLEAIDRLVADYGG